MPDAETVAAALRDRILDAELAPGAPLAEGALAHAHRVPRGEVRAALRRLEDEGIVRDGRVALVTAASVTGLIDLRTALETEAAARALARGEGRLPAPVPAALDRLRAACAGPSAATWRSVARAHLGFHGALVAAGGSARILAAHRALEAEELLFAAALRPVFDPAAMVVQHEELVHALETRGPEAVREHLADGLRLVLAALAAQAGP